MCWWLWVVSGAGSHGALTAARECGPRPSKSPVVHESRFEVSPHVTNPSEPVFYTPRPRQGRRGDRRGERVRTSLRRNGLPAQGNGCCTWPGSPRLCCRHARFVDAGTPHPRVPETCAGGGDPGA